MSDTSATDGAGEHRFRWRLAAIAGAALVLRVLYVFLVTGDQPIAQSDALYYSAQAVTVGDGRGFTEPYDPARSGPRADHPPLTAIVAAPATWLPDGQWLGQARFQVGQRLTMALIGSMTVFMVGLFTRRTLRARPAAERGGPSPEDAPEDAPVDDSVAVPENAPAGGDAGRSNRGHRLGIHPERAGLLAAGIAALSPNLWVHDGLVMSESIGALTLVLALWMAVGAWERPSLGRWFGLGAAIGLAALARAEALALVAILGIPMVIGGTLIDRSPVRSVRTAWQRFVTWWRGGEAWSAFRSTLLMGLGVGLVLAPWVGPNLVRFERPVTMSTNDGLTVLGSYCESMYSGGGAGLWDLSCIRLVDTDGDGINDWDEFQAGTLEAPGAPDASVYSEAWRKQGLGFAAGHLDQLADVATIRVLRTWGLWRPGQMADMGTGEYRPRTVGLLGWATHLASLPFALLGLVTLWRARRPVWPILSQALAVTLISAAFYGQWRFRIGWDVVVCTALAVGLLALPAQLTAWKAERSRPYRQPSKVFPTLDGIRALAMFSIFFLHVAGHSGADGRSDWGRFFTRLDVGLSVFYLISGFLICRPFIRSALDRAGQDPSRRGADPISGPGLRTYAVRRIVRLMPVFWVALVPMFVLGMLVVRNSAGEYVQGRPSIAQLLGMATFVNTASAETAIQGIPQAWSLGVEVGFYLLVPLIFVMASRLRRSGAGRAKFPAWVPFAAVYAVGAAFRYGVAFASPSWAPSAAFWTPTYLDIFALGAILALISARAERGHELPRPVRFLAEHPAVSWLIGLTLWAVVVNPLEVENHFFTLFAGRPAFGDVGGEFAVRNTLYGLAAGALCIPAFFGNQDQGTIRKFLASAPMRYLGTLSLGFYLWHIFWIVRVEEWLDIPPFNGPPVTLSLLAAAFTIPTAMLSYYAVERPSRRWVQGRFGSGPVAGPSEPHPPSNADSAVVRSTIRG